MALSIQEEINVVLKSPSVHTLTKSIIKQACQLDPVDAYFYVELALSILKRRMDDSLGL